jgi:DNA-binding transcriptional MerR regulator
MDAVEIPPKKNFKIGEVAKLFGLEPYVLRYWETEFDSLKPRKTASGQRSYNRDDVELVATIQHLLYTEMYTIAGARRQLERADLLDLELPNPTVVDDGVREELEQARDDARERAAELEVRLADVQAELAALEIELARLEEENTTLRGRADSRDAALRDRAGRQRRILLDVRRELQEVATAARNVA